MKKYKDMSETQKRELGCSLMKGDQAREIILELYEKVGDEIVSYLPPDSRMPSIVKRVISESKPHWSAKYWTPENICVGCGHARMSHLDQPDLKGGPESSDRGWTTLPEGKCIFQGCDCTEFVEPDCDKLDSRRTSHERHRQ